MHDVLPEIAALQRKGYKLTLYRNAIGACRAELRRSWLRKKIRFELDTVEFDEAKRLLGTSPANARAAGSPKCLSGPELQALHQQLRSE